MTELTIQKLTKKQKDSIRWMYFGNFEPTDIEIRTGIDLKTIRFFIFGEDETGSDPTCLFQIKKQMSSTAISSFLFDKAAVFDQTAGVALSILNKSLQNLQVEVNNGKELTVDELNKLATIVTSMDKLNRLESGLATETIEYMGLSRSEAVEILRADPFAPKTFEVETLPWLKDE